MRPADDYHAASQVYVPHLLSRSVPCGAEPLAAGRVQHRRPAGFCQEQTLVMTEQFSSMEHDAFHVSYLSDKIPEAVSTAFHRFSVLPPAPSFPLHVGFWVVQLVIR